MSRTEMTVRLVTILLAGSNSVETATFRMITAIDYLHSWVGHNFKVSEKWHMSNKGDQRTNVVTHRADVSSVRF